MRTRLFWCPFAFAVFGCGLEGPAPQNAPDAAKAGTAPVASIAPPTVAKTPVAAPRSQNTPPASAAAAPDKAAAPASSAPSQNGTADPGTPQAFLDKMGDAPAGLEWDTSMVAERAGVVHFHVSSQGRFAVTVITDKAYKAFLSGDEKNVSRQDMLFARDSAGTEMDGQVAVPAGTCWFVLGNKTESPVAFHLKCDLATK